MKRTVTTNTLKSGSTLAWWICVLIWFIGTVAGIVAMILLDNSNQSIIFGIICGAYAIWFFGGMFALLIWEVTIKEKERKRPMF